MTDEALERFRVLVREELERILDERGLVRRQKTPAPAPTVTETSSSRALAELQRIGVLPGRRRPRA